MSWGQAFSPINAVPAVGWPPEPLWVSISAVSQEYTTEPDHLGEQAVISLHCLVKREGFSNRLDLTLRGQVKNIGEVVLPAMRGANHPLAHHMEWLPVGRNRERLAEVEPAKDDATVRIDSRKRLFGGFKVVGGDQQHVGTQVGRKLVLVWGMGDRDGFESARFLQLQADVAQPTDTQHRDPVTRFRLRVSQAAPSGIAQAHHGRGVRVGQPIGQQYDAFRRNCEVLSVPALRSEAGRSGRNAVDGRLAGQRVVLSAVRASTAQGLYPGGADSVSNLARVDARTDFDDFADHFVTRGLGINVTASPLSCPHIRIAHASYDEITN